jgi:hypothetical protein
MGCTRRQTLWSLPADVLYMLLAHVGSMLAQNQHQLLHYNSRPRPTASMDDMAITFSCAAVVLFKAAFMV